MWKLKKTKDIFFYIILLLTLTGVFSYYYWCIQLTFIPDFEALISVEHAWKNNNGYGTYMKGILVPLCTFFYQKYGYTYTTLRLAYVVVYFILSICILDIVIRPERRTVKLYVLPIYALFMVFYQYIISLRFGNFAADWQQYPFNQHVENIVFCAIGVWLLKELERSTSVLKRCILVFLITLLIIYGAFTNIDILIFATFILPLGGAFLLRIPQIRERKGMYIVYGTAAICVVVSLLKVGSYYYMPLSKLFQDASDAIYRGSTSYISSATWPRCVNFFMGELAGFFNFDMSLIAQTSQSVLICLIRIALVLFGFSCIYRQIKAQLSKENKVSIVEGTISWACVLLLFVMFFSTWGADSHYVRYFNMLVPYVTIMICNYSDKFPEWIHLPYLNNKKVFSGIMLLVILGSIPYGGLGDTRKTIYDTYTEELVNILDEKELHTGYCQSRLIASRIVAASEGENLIVGGNTEENLWMCDEHSFFYDYVVFWKLASTSVSEETMKSWLEQYGDPDEIVEVGNGTYTVYIYREGFGL